MATFKCVVLAGKEKESGENNIKILITHKSIFDKRAKNAYIKTEYYVETDMIKGGRIKKEHPNASRLNAKLKAKTLEYENKLLEYDERFLSTLSVDQIRDIVQGKRIDLNLDFFSYAKKRIREIKDEGREGTAKSYEDSVKRFKEYSKTDWLPFTSIEQKTIEGFIRDRKKALKAHTSIGIYFRSIKAIFNDAKLELNKPGIDSVINHDPFAGIELENGMTKDRSIDIEVLKQIKTAELTGIKSVSRDMAMLIFYFKGVNVKDLFYCKGLVSDRFNYVRSKGKKEYSIKVESEAKEIIDRYKGERFLLKFADNIKQFRGERKPHERKLYEYKDHLAFTKMINENLKDIAKQLKISEPLSTYYFRYAWGNIARDVCGIDLDDISLGYGHKRQDLKITWIYYREKLKKLDADNRKVIDALKSGEGEFIYEI